MRSREDVLDSSAEAARWVADALANARTWFPDITDDELRGPLEQAFELAGRSVRGEREYHAVFEAELHRAVEERTVLGATGSVLPPQSGGAPRAFPFGNGRSVDPLPHDASVVAVKPLPEELVELPVEAPEIAPPAEDHVAEAEAPAPPFTEALTPGPAMPARGRERPRVPIASIKADELRAHVRTAEPARPPAPAQAGKRRAIRWRRPVAVSLVALMLAPLTVVLVVILSRGSHHAPPRTAAVSQRVTPPATRVAPRPVPTAASARAQRLVKLRAAHKRARALAQRRAHALALQAAYRRKLAAWRRRSRPRPPTVQRTAPPVIPTPAPRAASPPPSHSSGGGGGSGGSSEFGIEP
jgi:hypothetical protein